MVQVDRLELLPDERIRKTGRPSRLILIVVWVALFLVPAAQATAQQRKLPRDLHYNRLTFRQYYLAEYNDAEKSFSRGAKSAYKFGERRYLDSICFWTMIGECYYHMGNYAEAIEMYDRSLELYLSWQSEDWQGRIQPAAIIQPNNNAVNRAKISWGSSQRNAAIAREPDTNSVLFGRLDADRVLRQGGVVQNAEYYQIRVTEIMRCAALCLHRRRSIQGPTCKFSPFTARLVSGLSMGNAGNGTLMGAYNGVLLGIAQASMDDWDKASRTLSRSLQINGGMDHSLTPVALIELSKIGFATGNNGPAGQAALEASYSAAIFGQYDLVEEALGLATTIHLTASPTPYPPLQNAIAWARREDARMLEASLIVKLAECHAEGGNAVEATNVLRQTKGAISRRNSLGNAVVSARLKYVDALTLFLEADFSAGMARLSQALEHFQTGSLWLYRLALADNLVVLGEINQRQADQLYSVLLRDPTAADWRTDPMESIAFLASPHVGAMERWFEIVVDKKDNRRGLEIADLVRRHRFFSQLPLGGRLMAFRWVMHAPEESLTPEGWEQRNEFLNRNPTYKALVDRAEEARLRLLALPLKPDEKSSEHREQRDLLKALANISSTQEAMLASFALRREPVEMAFPPQTTFSEFQERIGKDQFALVSLTTTNGYHMFLVNTQSIQYVGLINSRVMLRGVGGFNKQLGLTSSAIDLKTIQDDQWKEMARELKSMLFAGIDDANWSSFKEIVVVPDGILWYLPFEALLLDQDGEEKFLSDVVNIRYSPTLFLAFGPQRPQRQLKRSVIVTAQMNARGNDALTNSEFAELVKALPTAIEFAGKLRVPSNYFSSLFDQLVVWSEIRSSKTAPLAMAPMQLDQARNGTIQAWMALPWWGPEYITMPGFQSGIGGGLRGPQLGSDLFMTSVGLMASGTRTLLISRWNTGGKTALELTRHYAAAIPNIPVNQAILESRQKTRESELDYENEPRIRTKKSNPSMKAEHPFFWAGHMLFSIPEDRPVGDPKKDDAIDGGMPDPKIDPPKKGDGALVPEKDKLGLPGGDDRKPDAGNEASNVKSSKLEQKDAGSKEKGKRESVKNSNRSKAARIQIEVA